MQMEAILLAFRQMEVNVLTLLLVLLDLMCPGGQSVTGLASGTPANATEAKAHEFALTLSTTIACDVPLPESCQADDNELDGSQWDAFRVKSYLFPSPMHLSSALYFEAHQTLFRQTNGGTLTSQFTLRRATQ